MKTIKIAVCSLLFAVLFFSHLSCDKKNIDFGNELLTADPNIRLIDTMQVDLSTLQVDSFNTSGKQIMAIGSVTDPMFGKIHARTYTEFALPSNELNGLSAFYDSIVLRLKPNGNYYGDTSASVTISVNRLTEKMDLTVNTGYNLSRDFNQETLPLGTITTEIFPAINKEIKIRLSDLFGKELFDKLKNNDIDIRNSENFKNYFKGISIKTDTTISSNINFFPFNDTTGLIQLFYHKNSAVNESKHLDLKISSSEIQFNKFDYNRNGSGLNQFTPGKKQTLSSAKTNNKAFLNNGEGTYIKISFPTILNLKEIAPYIKILKAELILHPDIASYSYPFTLPGKLQLAYTDDSDQPVGYVVDNNNQPQTGNLYIDKLYQVETKYSYDITEFISQLIREGRFSKSALLLMPSVADLNNSFQRLLINNQLIPGSIQLKLYVLGL